MRCLRTYRDAKKRLLDARRKADVILAGGSNRLLLVEAILLVCVFAALFFSLLSAASLLLSVIAKNEELSSLLWNTTSLLCFSLAVFFAAPVALGLFRLAEQMQAGENPVLLDLFYFLSNRERYLQGLQTTCRASVKVILMALIADTVYMLCPVRGLDGVLAALVVTLFTVWMFLPYQKLYSRLRKADKPLPKNSGLHFFTFFFPWLLLGLVSIGLLLVLDVFPRMLLTYFCDCDRNETSH